MYHIIHNNYLMVKRITKFKQLRACVDRSRPLLIQTHDYPDHDAIASSYALQQLFAKFSHPASLCYGGIVLGSALQNAIHELKIDIQHISKAKISAETQLIMIDGSVDNGNMQVSQATPMAVIDHHASSKTFASRYLFSDIRSSYGSCSTIISEYFEEAGIAISPVVATALMIGIMMDTAHLTRGVHYSDIRAIARLYPLADWHTGSRLLRNSLSISDSQLFHEAIANRIIRESICFVALQHDTTPDVAGLIADFFLSLQEVHFVVVICCRGERFKLSIRSEDETLPADTVLASLLKDIGEGGGHIHMAGGIIARDRYPGDTEMLERLQAIKRQMQKI